MAESRTALVTGAASGIGRALALLLAERGYRLVLVDFESPGLDAVATELPSSVAIPTDVADPFAVENLADVVGAVDLLCLNAGVTGGFDGPPWESPPAEWQRVLGANLGGVVNGLRSFVPLMLDRDSPSKILITASLAGVLTWPGGGPYAASKHAAMAVAEQAALALADSQVTVTVLCPSLVRTAMSKQGDDPALVAVRALRAVSDGTFAVIPRDWSAAVVDRARMLAAGDQPVPPHI